MAAMAEKLCMKGGWSLDLETSNDKGVCWNCDDSNRRKEARDLIVEDPQGLVVASPMCAACSALQGLNYFKMDPKALEEKLTKAFMHLGFALQMCEIQAELN